MTGGTSQITTAVYGLSTEGYRIASSIAVKGFKVSLIDEAARMAIWLKPDIARTYPDVSSLIEDEPLLALEPVDVAVSEASYIFFAPKIRKVGQEVKSDVTSKFRDATKAVRKGTSVVYTLPTGIGGNNENMALIEHVTGMTVGKDIFYYYMPINQEIFSSPEIIVGALKSKQDAEISKMLYDPDIRGRINYIDIISAEFMHSIRVLGHYAHMASVLEICKNFKDINIKSEPINRAFSDLYIDDIANGITLTADGLRAAQRAAQSVIAAIAVTGNTRTDRRQPPSPIASRVVTIIDFVCSGDARRQRRAVIGRCGQIA